jgi:hypothetical protein
MMLQQHWTFYQIKALSSSHLVLSLSLSLFLFGQKNNRNEYINKNFSSPHNKQKKRKKKPKQKKISPQFVSIIIDCFYHFMRISIHCVSRLVAELIDSQKEKKNFSVVCRVQIFLTQNTLTKGVWERERERDRERDRDDIWRESISVLVIYCSMRWILLFIRMKRIYLIYIMMIIASFSCLTTKAYVNSPLKRKRTKSFRKCLFAIKIVCVEFAHRQRIPRDDENQRCLMERHERRFSALPSNPRLKLNHEFSAVWNL